MPNLTDIRTALAEALAMPGVQVSAYMVANPIPPTIWVFPDEIDYDQAAGRGLDDVYMTVQAFVGVSTDIGAQQRLDRMLAPSGAESVKELAESDLTLGGTVDDVTVETCTGYRLYPRPDGGPVLGAEWRVRVMANGN